MAFEKFEHKSSWNYAKEPYISLSKRGQIAFGKCALAAFLSDRPSNIELYFDNDSRSIGMMTSNNKGLKINYRKHPQAIITLPKEFIKRYKIIETGRFLGHVDMTGMIIMDIERNQQ